MHEYHTADSSAAGEEVEAGQSLGVCDAGSAACILAGGGSGEFLYHAT